MQRWRPFALGADFILVQFTPVSGNRALADIVATRDAALRLARVEALAGLLLLVRGEDRLAAEFDAVRLRVSLAASGAFERGLSP